MNPPSSTMQSAVGVLLALVLPAVLLAQTDNSSHWTAGTPIPEWVDPVRLPEISGKLDGSKWGDTRYILVDGQTQTGPDYERTFHHRATQAVTTTGITDVSTITFNFDPSFVHLYIHGIWIHRGSERIDALKPADLKVVQQESDLSRRIYDGSIQVIAFLPDVRVGDIIERAYTLDGRNPAMGSHYSKVWRLGYTTAVDRLRVRVIVGGSRQPQIKHFNTDERPTITKRAAETIYQWDLANARGKPYEDSKPSWSLVQPRVQISDFESWAEVAAWGDAHYRPLITPESRMPSELRKMIREWKQLATPADRVSAALRFVQDDIRYLGIEVGPSGLIPHNPVQVFNQRFGDCKDKAILLTTILRAMDIAADVAMLDTDWKHSVADMLPSPYAFDHVIATADIGGELIWMDATQSLQRGPLKDRMPPDYRRALIVSQETTGLAVIPEATLSEPTFEVLEEYAKQADGSVLLTVTTTHRGDKADAVRYTLAGQSHEETARDYLNFYATDDPKIAESSEFVVDDDGENNVIVLTESYKLPMLFPDGPRDFNAWAITAETIVPSTKVRQSPVTVSHPSWVKQVIRVTGTGRFNLDDDSETIESQGLRVNYEADHSSDGFELSWEMKSLADNVAPGDMSEHLKALDDIGDLTGYRVWSHNRLGSATSSGDSALFWYLMIPVIVVGVRLGVSFLRKRKAQKRREFRTGESPFEAFPGTLEQAAASLRCTCGGLMSETVDEPTPVRYEEKSMLAATLRCNSCSGEQTFYVGT